MSPSDKNKPTGNSSSGKSQTQLCSNSCEMDLRAESTSPSTSNVTLAGHGSIINIPWVTASQSTIKCSVNNQMKTFDPGEGGGIERLISTNSGTCGNSVFLGKSCSSLIKNNNKNYKAGSKINKLADMLAKRSQNLVEVKQNTSDIIMDITSAPKLKEESVVLKSVSNEIKSVNGSCLESSTINNEVKLFRKSRRKSVPNQSYTLQRWQSQSTSKSCSDIFELFPLKEKDKITELNALGGSMSKLQTDESTKKKVVETNSKTKLPLAIPDKKRMSLFDNDTSTSSKIIDKNIDKPVEIPLKKSIGKPTEKPLEKFIEKPMEASTRKLNEKLKEEATEMHLIEKMKENNLQKPMESRKEKQMEKPVERFSQKLTVKIMDKPMEKTVEKTKEKFIIKSLEKHAKKLEGNPIETFKEISLEDSKKSPLENPKEKPKENYVKNSLEKPLGNFLEKPKEKPLTKSTEKLTENITEKFEEKITGNHVEKPIEKCKKNLIENFMVKCKEKVVENFTEDFRDVVSGGELMTNLKENNVKNFKEEKMENVMEKSEEKIVESLVEKFVKKSDENLIENVKENSVGKFKVKVIENLTKKCRKEVLENPAEKIIEESDGKLMGKLEENSTEKFKGEVMENLEEKPKEKSKKHSFERSIEKCKVEFLNKPKEKAKENSTDKYKENSEENIIEKPEEECKEKKMRKCEEKLMENFTEKPKEKFKENPIKISAQKVKEKLMEKSKEKFVVNLKERVEEKLFKSSFEKEKTIEKTLEKPKEKTMEITLEKPKEKAMEKTLEKPKEKTMEKTLEKLKEKAMEKTLEKLKEKAMEKALEKPKGEAMEKTLEKPKEKAMEKAWEKPKEKAMEKAWEKPKGEAMEKTSEKPKEKTMEKTLEKPKEKAMEITLEKPKGEAMEKTLEKPEEKAVEKTLKKPKGEAMEKTLEKPKEKTMEKTLEKPKEKAMEITLEKPKGEAMEKTSEKPKDKAMEKTLEKPKEKALEITLEKPKEKAMEKTLEKLKEKAMEKTLEKPKEKAMEITLEKPKGEAMEKTLEKPKEKTMEKTLEKPKDKAMEITLEKPKEKAMEKTLEKLKGEAMEKTLEKLKEKAMEKTLEKPEEKAMEKTLEKPKGEAMEKTLEKPKEKTMEKTLEKPKEKAMEITLEKPKGEAMEKTSEKPKDKAMEKTLEKPKEKALEITLEKPKEKAKEKTLEKPKHKAMEKTLEKPKEKTVEKLQDKFTEKTGEKFTEELQVKHEEHPDAKLMEKSMKELKIKETEKIKGKKIENILEEMPKTNMKKSKKKVKERIMDNSLVVQTETVRKTRERSCKNIVAPRFGRSSKYSDIYFKKKERKLKQRKLKRLVESSTQTADIEFISVIKPTNIENELRATAEIVESENVKPKKSKAEETEKTEPENERPKIVTYECLYCTQTFTVWELCKAHEKTHSPRKYKQFRCQYCSKKLFSLEEFKNHCIQKHRNKYAYCKKCDFRFSAKDELYSHNKEIHLKRSGESFNVVFDEHPNSLAHGNAAAPGMFEEVKTSKKIGENEAGKEVSEEKRPQKVLEESVAHKDSEEIQEEKVPEKISVQKNSEGAEVQKVFEEKSKKKHLKERVGQVISVEKEVKKIPEEKVLTKIPERRANQRVFEEILLRDVPEEEKIKITHLEQEIKKVPEEKKIKKIPEEKAVKKISSKKTLKKAFKIKAFKKFSPEREVKKIFEEKKIGKALQEKADQAIQDEKALEKLLEEKEVTKITEEKAVLKVLQKALLPKVPEQIETKKIPEEKAVQKVLEETLLPEIPEEIETKKIPEEKAVQKVLEETLLPEIPEEIETKKIPEEKAVKTIYEEKTSQKVVEEKVDQMIVDEKEVKKNLEEKAVTKITEEKGVQKALEETLHPKIPEEIEISKVPEEMAVKKNSYERAVKNSLEVKAFKKFCSQQAVKNVFEEKMGEEVLQEKADQMIPDEKAVKKHLKEKAVTKIWEEKAVQKVLEETLHPEIPEEIETKKIPEEKAVKKIFHEKAVKKACPVKTFEKFCPEQAIKKVFEEKTSEKVFQEKAHQIIPDEKAFRKILEEKAVTKDPEEAKVQKVLEEALLLEVPEKKEIKKVPEEAAVKKISHEKAVKIAFEEKAFEKFCAEQAAKKVYEEKTSQKVVKEKVDGMISDEKAVKKLLEEKAVIKITKEATVEKILEETLLPEIPEEIEISKVPEEMAVKETSHEKAVKMPLKVKEFKKIFPELAVKKVFEKKMSGKIFEEKADKMIPDGKAVKNIQEVKMTTKITKEKAVQKVLQGTLLRQVPQEKEVEKILDEKTSEKVLQEKAGTMIPDEKAFKKLLEEKAITMITREKTVPKVLKETLLSEVPEEKEIKKVPEEKAIKKISDKKTVNQTFEEKAFRKLCMEQAVKKVFGEKTDGKIFDGKADQMILDEKVVKNNLEEKAVTNMREKKAVQKVLEEALLPEVTEEKGIKKIPEEKAVKKISHEKAVKNAFEVKAFKKFCPEQAVKKVIEEKLGGKVLQEKPCQMISHEKAFKKIVEEKAVAKITEEKEAQKVLEETLFPEVSEEKEIKKVPEEKAVKNISDKKTVNQAFEGKAFKKFCPEQATSGKVLQEKADQNAVKKLLEEKVVAKITEEKAVRKALEETLLPEVSEEKEIKKVPEEMAIKKSSHEKAVKNAFEVKAFKKFCSEQAVRKVYEEKTNQKIIEEKADETIPDEKSDKMLLEEKAVTKITEEKAVQKILEETLLPKIPDEIEIKKSPEEKAIKKISNEKPEKNAFEEKALKKFSGEHVVKKVFEEKVGRKVPEKKAIKKILYDKSGKKAVEEKMGRKVLEEKTDKKFFEEQTDKKILKNSPKTDLRIDVSFDSTKKSSVSPRNSLRCSPKENKTEEQILEMEMLFYSHLSGNIRENLTNHLDGKIDQSGMPVRKDHVVEIPESTKSSPLLSVAIPSAGTSDIQILRSPSPYQTRSKTPNPLPPTAKKFKKLPNWQQKFWEKYNFPTNYRYQHRFWDKNYLNTEKSAFYLKDLSCLDIKTQLTMRDNIKKLDEVKKIEENSKPTDELKFPDYLCLIPRANKVSSLESKVDLQKNSLECVKTKKQIGKEDTKKSFKSPGSELPIVKNRSKTGSDNSDSKKQSSEGLKMVTRRQSSLESTKDDKEDNSKKRKGSLDLSVQRMALRRQTSLDNIGSNVPKVEKNDQDSAQILNNLDLETSPMSPTGSPVISGEWVRPRSYLCGTCCTKFTNLWELEDHKWVSHPNVWCTHYEFEDEKIDKLFQKNEDDGVGESGESSEMSKSKLTDLYKRYLLPHGYLKTAKLVPKTNFPEECTKCKKNCMNASEMHKHMLDCGGDTTWFLTMYSSPLTIKRKWRPFGSRRKKQIGRRDVKRNIPTTPTLRSYHYQHRIRTKPGDVETIQKMLANLPEKRARRAINFDEIKTRSQATIHSNRLLRKRFKSTFSNNFLKLKNMKQKRQLKQGKKEGSSKSTTDTSSENTPVGSPKRRNKLKESLQLLKEENSRDGSSENSEDVMKIQKKKVQKKTELTDPSQKKNQVFKIEKPKLKKEILETNQEKPVTRSNGFLFSHESKTKKKASAVKEEVLDEIECKSDCPVENKQPKSASKSKSKKSTGKTLETVAVKEAVASENVNVILNVTNHSDREPSVKVAKKIKVEAEASLELKPCNRTNPHSNNQSILIDAHCDPMLRLKQNSKAKNELFKSIKKKVKNSKKILGKKEAEKAEGGSRRSLRIKSLQQSESDPELLNKQISDSSKRMADLIMERDLKIKNVVVSLENTVPFKVISKSPKISNIKGEKETSEEISPIVRRSLRNSVSSEDKQEVQKNNDRSVMSFNPRSVLRRNFRNEKNDYLLSDTVEIFSPKTTTAPQTNSDEKNVVESKLIKPRISLLKRNNIQNPKAIGGILKSEELLGVRKLEAKKNIDLEEMPILAKVEPIRGKTSSKTEKEIPVLMPVEREQKRGLNDGEELEESSNSFQVIKKRRKNSKEVTPLKIIKTVENVNLEGDNGLESSFRIESSMSLENSFDSGKSKKKKLSKSPASKGTEKKVKTDVKKYFLGIDPNEIDKGRCDGQDESFSDNEPLICLVNNQGQNECRRNELIVKTEDVEIEKSESQLPSSEKSLTKNSTSKSDTSRELSNFFPEKSDVKSGRSTDSTQTVSQIFRETFKLKKNIKTDKKKRRKSITPTKELRVTVTLKEPTLKIIKKPVTFSGECKWSTEASEPKKSEVLMPPSNVEEVLPDTKEFNLPERRSRRISKETKSTNEFVIDDPLILVDELWSDLDSDSDSSKRKSKKGKKKSSKKKTNEEKRMSDVNLEELLRNFGENKEIKKPDRPSVIKIVKKRKPASLILESRRKAAENRKGAKSYKRLSLKLFRYNKMYRNFGNRGVKLSEAKKALQEKLDELQARSSNALPDLPFLVAEIKENPIQVIQCGAQRSKTKKGPKKVDVKHQSNDIHMKISLPLEAINNLPVFNNNHLTEPVLEKPKQCSPVGEKISESSKCEKETSSLTETALGKESELVEDEAMGSNDDAGDLKNKAKRSDVIDKIFYCEICKTYYYSSSQLKIHKLSNRHKLKESELQHSRKLMVQSHDFDDVKIESSEIQSIYSVPVSGDEKILQNPSKTENLEERQNDDTLEMPTLEGPFIENPFTRLAPQIVQEPSPPPPVASFGFTQESLKDIQKAIGCTDEEMLILTLLGENTIEIENDILDLDSCKSTQSKVTECTREKVEKDLKDNEKANEAFKVDLKQRMTSALACLVNKAVFNLLQKYENAAKTTVNPEALSLLGKLSNLSRRKNVLQLNELLKKRSDGESSVNAPSKEREKKEAAVSYKYQCTICGNRFEKASTRECHISRSHRGKAKKHTEDLQSVQIEEEWNDSWSYDVGDDQLESTTTPQFWCSDCGINFMSPQEVLDHQKVEHQAGIKDPDQNRDSGPLQSSTIGSSDEIFEGKKCRRRPKLFSSEELNQQRIIANNELRKLDRRFSNKNKSSKTKWGMDALKFTVEKEKTIIDDEDKEVVSEESPKPPIEVKNIDLVPKLNLSRISNIPEFKIIQKNSFENRFQKIIDNKLKRKCACPSKEENAADDIEEEVMLVPVVVKKKNKKQKLGKCSSKKEETGKTLDVYDFNESESEGEPAVYSHIKKPMPSPMKIKLVKEKEAPSKNKADSTTKDLAPDDYDSEDSLPLSVVKKSKPGDEDDDKDEKISEDGVEKSDGILEQVEYLIEQLENETGSLKNESVRESEFEQESDTGEENEKPEFLKKNSSKSAFTASKSLRVSVASKFLEMDEILLKSRKRDKSIDKKSELQLKDDGVNELTGEENESILAEPESSQSTFDEEDSIPLVLISKKAEKSKFNQETKKCDENTTDVSTTASEDVSLLRVEENKNSDARDSSIDAKINTEESSPLVFSSSENDGAFSGKSVKAFETLNGNVIYCRNDSMTDFDSDLSNDGLIDSNYEKNNFVEHDKNFIKEVTEKEDVVIICSKRVGEESNGSKISKELRSIPGKGKNQSEILIKKKKKRFPLLTATIEENNFRRSESPKSNKEVIVRKIWSRKKLTEDSTDNDEDSFTFMDNNTSIENLHEDESRTEIEKEIIVKKIWSRKKAELEEDFTEKVEESYDDIKINQTEVSDEVVIKCGPKAKSSPKRRKSRSSNEASKDTIMRKIWSGKCTFQTKAALKTYESDVLPDCKEDEGMESQSRSKRRRRPSSFSATKRSKIDSDKDDEDDDLDSLLEEIEREQLEKAIRSEFLQLRRSEKANVEMKENGTPTVGIFTEATLDLRKEISDKKRRKIKKKLKHPKQSLLKRKKIVRKPFRRVLPTEDRNIRENISRICLDEHSENSLDKNVELFRGPGKIKNRKHKKHRHKHHHHKHKHKKSKHHKSALSKRKSKHEFGKKEEVSENADSFTILEKICQEIPNQIENESQRSFKRRSSAEMKNADSKSVEVFSLDSKKSEIPEVEFENSLSGKRRFESVNIYEFVEDVSDLSSDRIRNLKK